MYIVSDDYKDKIISSERSMDYIGKIKLSDGTEMEISGSDVAAGSFYVDRKAVNNSEFAVGGCYASEIGLGLFYDSSHPYSLQGAEITISVRLKISENTFESIPQGIFAVDEIQREKNIVYIKALDNMIKFDKAYPKAVISDQLPFSLVSDACQNCGVTLKNTSFADFANYSLKLSAEENQINTYRDLIGMVCEVLGAFAIINRSGELEIRKFTCEAVAEYDDFLASTPKFSDAMVTIGKVIYNNTVAGTSGQSLIMQTNPFFETLTEEQLLSALGEIRTQLSGVSFYGCEATTYGDPALDAGDMITIRGKPILLMSYTWSFRGFSTIESYGDQTSDVEYDSTKRLAQTVANNFNYLKANYLDVYSITATYATINSLEAANANIAALTAENAQIKLLVADKVSAAELTALKGEFTELYATRISVEQLESQKADISELNAVTARVDTLESNTVTMDYLKANYAKITKLDAATARIETLEANSATIDFVKANYATIAALSATKANVTALTSDTANIKNILAGNIGTGDLQTINLTAANALVSESFAKSLVASQISVEDLLAGNISTNRFTIVSDSGNFQLTDNTIQICDDSRVRVQAGKDANGDYSLYVWDQNGNLMFDALGLREDGIKSEIIRNDMIAPNANISGSKLDVDSVITEINNTSKTIKASQIKLDATNQTLEVGFCELTDTITSEQSKTSAMQTQLNIVQGQITSKIWQSDIATAINDIEVGGRNLLLNTNFIEKRDNTATTTKSFPIYVDAKHLPDIPNRTLTFSFYQHSPGDRDAGLSTNTDLQNRFGLHGTIVWSDSTGTNSDKRVYPFVAYLTAASTNARVSMTTTVTPPTGYDTISSMFVSLNVYAKPAENNTETWSVGYPKLEFGTIATDWTPAPEDTQEQLDKLTTSYSEIKQTTDSISLTVAAHTTRIDNLTSSFDTAETQITQNTEAITSVATRTTVVENNFANYSTTEEMKSELTQSAASIKSEIAAVYATQTALTEVKTLTEQTATQFTWLVASGTSATDFTLTDRAAKLTAEYINLNGLVMFSGLDSSTQSVVNAASSDAQAALAEITSLEIGGRNLLRNADFTSGKTSWYGTNNTTITVEEVDSRTAMLVDSSTTSGTATYASLYQTVSSVELNTKFTLSCQFYCETDSNIILTAYYKNGSSWVAIKQSRKSINAGWNRITHSFVSNDTYNVLVVAFGCLVGENVYIYHPKLEVGTMATDFTIAPEDTNDLIFTAQTTAESAQSTIASWCYDSDKTLIDGGKIYTGTVTADKLNVVSLEAIAAQIGGFSIGSSYIANNTAVLAGAANSVYLGTDGISCGTAFKVTKSGALTAISGTIGGWTIGNSTISNTNGVYTTVLSCYDNAEALSRVFHCHDSDGNDTFRIYRNGLVYLISSEMRVGSDASNQLRVQDGHIDFYYNSVKSGRLGQSGDNKIAIEGTHLQLDSAKYLYGDALQLIGCSGNGNVIIGSPDNACDVNIYTGEGYYAKFVTTVNGTATPIIAMSQSGLQFKNETGILLNDKWAFRYYSNAVYCGADSLPLKLVGSSVTANGTSVTSDLRLKTDICPLSDKYEALIDSIDAVNYRFTNYRQNVINCGFIAQDVLAALSDAGLTADEFGGFVDIYGDGREFALDYTQFIPILWEQIKKLKAEINQLKGV